MTLFIYIQAHIFTIIYINIKMYIEKTTFNKNHKKKPVSCIKVSHSK